MAPPPTPDQPDPHRGGLAAPLGRRALLAAAGSLGLAALAAGCGGSRARSGTTTAPAGSLGALTAGAQQLSFLGAQSELPVGHSLLTFGLSTPDNRLLTGGQPRVWAALDPSGRARGPFTATWLELDAYQATKDTSPRSDLHGFYAVTVELPSPGNWQLVAVPSGGQQRQAAAGAVPVHQHVVAAVGTKARRRASGCAPARRRARCTPSRSTARWPAAGRRWWCSPPRCCAPAACAARSSTRPWSPPRLPTRRRRTSSTWRSTRSATPTRH